MSRYKDLSVEYKGMRYFLLLDQDISVFWRNDSSVVHHEKASELTCTQAWTRGLPVISRFITRGGFGLKVELQVRNVFCNNSVLTILNEAKPHRGPTERLNR